MHWETEGIFVLFFSSFAFVNQKSGNLFSSTVQGPAPLTQDEPLAEMHLRALCRYSLPIILPCHHRYWSSDFMNSVNVAESCALQKQQCSGRTLRSALCVHIACFESWLWLKFAFACFCFVFILTFSVKSHILIRRFKSTLFPCFVATTHEAFQIPGTLRSILVCYYSRKGKMTQKWTLFYVCLCSACVW